MLPIYYGTSSLTFCQISGFKKAFEKVNKHQTVLKLDFEEHASDWVEEKVNFYPSYTYLFFLQQRFVQSYATNLLGDIFLNYLPTLGQSM
jgi:hypothetical protein